MIDIEYKYYEKNTIGRKLSIFWYGWIKGYKLKSDIIGKPAELGGDYKLRRCDKWTDEDKASLQSKGYRPIKGLNDSILWLVVPQYAKLSNLKKFDVRQCDKYGRPLYSLDTAGTLNDSMKSDNDAKFIKGMGKAALPSMDLQTIIMIVIIGAGAIFGLKFLGAF